GAILGRVARPARRAIATGRTAGSDGRLGSGSPAGIRQAPSSVPTTPRRALQPPANRARGKPRDDPERHEPLPPLSPLGRARSRSAPDHVRDSALHRLARIGG